MTTDAPLNPLFDIALLAGPLARGELILTPNLRLSRKIREAWQHAASQTSSHWQPANVLPLESWLQECWLQLQDAAFEPALAGTLIKPHQAQWLWQQVIAADDQSPALNATSFVEQARSSWALVRQWQLSLSELENSYHEGARTLCRWGRSWEEGLRQRELVSSEQRAAIIGQGFQAQYLARLPVIHLLGFQTLAPLYRQLLQGAGEHIHDVDTADTGSADTAPAPTLRCAAEIDSELLAAAQWAKNQSERCGRERIAVVIPDLASLRTKVERIFTQVFDPASSWPDAPFRPHSFNISAATPLSDTPLVAAALQLLDLNRNEQTNSQLCNLLNNPFWGQISREGEQRCRAIAALTETCFATLPTTTARQLIADNLADQLNQPEDKKPREASADAASLATRLLQLATAQRSLKSRQSFTAWRQTFEQQLNLLGWPGERTLNSLEYQQREHWQAALDQFELLDRVAPAVTVEEALRQLRPLMANTSFQAETPDSPVQILGTLEAAGLRFDQLWICQLDDRHWPAATQPTPLLPASLQRELKMPRACPAEELALSAALFRLLCANSGAVIASYSARDGDIHYQPSALIRDLATEEANPDTCSHPWLAAIASSAALQVIDDSQGPPLAPRSQPFPGAAAFIAAQAGCPFNAFATYRLGAQPLAEAMTGLTPWERGNLLHDSLDTLWRELQNLETLRTLDDPQRQERLAVAIDSAFQRYRQREPLRTRLLGQRYLQLEAERLAQLIDTWLVAIEAERLDFTVLHTEYNATVPLDGFPVRVRIDRVDELNDGRRVIIDYKTGSTAIKSLASPRLTEPQLALYALALGEPLAAIGYGVIQSRKLAFEGLALDNNVITGCLTPDKSGLPETWQSTLEKWHNLLKLIISELLSGRADVSFYSQKAVQYGAHLEPLNRLADGDRVVRFTSTTDVHTRSTGEVTP